MAAKDTNQKYPMPKKFEPSKGIYTLGGVLALVGFAAFLGGLFGGMEHRAWNGYLIGWWATLSLALCGPFFNATQYLSGAGWGVSIRRIPEAMGSYLIPAAVFGIIALAGADTLFIWLHESAANDAIIAKKSGFLTFGNMAFTTVASFVAWIAVVWAMRRNSVKQDETGDPSLTDTNKKLSVAFLVVFVLGFSFMTWFWLMSLEPHWFSTMYQVYAFAVLFQAGLALMAILLLHFKENDYFGDFVHSRQVLLVGQWLFAFSVFYAYIAFSQFLLIWYANIPEEAGWFVHRIQDSGAGWTWFIILFAGKFIIPFFTLLPQENKKNRFNALRYISYLLMFMLPFEIWWWVAFVPVDHHIHIDVPWLEVLIVLGFVGVFIITVARSLGSANIFPIKDLFLGESLEHHMHGELPEPKAQTQA